MMAAAKVKTSAGQLTYCSTAKPKGTEYMQRILDELLQNIRMFGDQKSGGDPPTKRTGKLERYHLNPRERNVVRAHSEAFSRPMQ